MGKIKNKKKRQFLTQIVCEHLKWNCIDLVIVLGSSCTLNVTAQTVFLLSSSTYWESRPIRHLRLFHKSVSHFRCRHFPTFWLWERELYYVCLVNTQRKLIHRTETLGVLRYEGWWMQGRMGNELGRTRSTAPCLSLCLVLCPHLHIFLNVFP